MYYDSMNNFTIEQVIYAKQNLVVKFGELLWLLFQSLLKIGKVKKRLKKNPAMSHSR